MAKYCLDCKLILNESAKYCQECGRSASDEAKSNQETALSDEEIPFSWLFENERPLKDQERKVNFEEYLAKNHKGAYLRSVKKDYPFLLNEWLLRDFTTVGNYRVWAYVLSKIVKGLEQERRKENLGWENARGNRFSLFMLENYLVLINDSVNSWGKLEDSFICLKWQEIASINVNFNKYTEKGFVSITYWYWGVRIITNESFWIDLFALAGSSHKECKDNYDYWMSAFAQLNTICSEMSGEYRVNFVAGNEKVANVLPNVTLGIFRELDT